MLWGDSLIWDCRIGSTGVLQDVSASHRSIRTLQARRTELYLQR